MNDTKPKNASKTLKDGAISLAQKSSRKHKDQPRGSKRNATLVIEVENHGTAAQIRDDEMLIISNVKYEVPAEKSNTKYNAGELTFQTRQINEYNSLVQQGKNPLMDHMRGQKYFLNGLKPRSKKIIEVPIALEDPTGQEGFYYSYKGRLETNVKYREFYAVGHTYKNVILNFPLLE